MRSRLCFPACLLSVLVACDTPQPAAPADPLLAARSLGPPTLSAEWVQEVFVDYAGFSHAGPGPHPVDESDHFALVQGGMRWFPNPTVVEYVPDPTSGPAGSDAVIVTAEDTWDNLITARTFAPSATSAAANPCTGQPNLVHFGPIDGPGGALAFAAVCRNIVTKEIAGFVMRLDTQEQWTTTGAPGAFDLENTVAHEFGHVAGLGHVRAPRDGCLTMYALVSPGETQKRTPGLGDKLGMQALYASTDVGPGACGS